MDLDDLLKRYGVRPSLPELVPIRQILREAACLERTSQGAADTELMKLCCVQLFNAAQLNDVLEIWNAKTSSMDSDASIDIQLLCGAGIAATKDYLAASSDPAAIAALQRLTQAEQAGDFDGFSGSKYRAFWDDYYSGVNPG